MSALIPDPNVLVDEVMLDDFKTGLNADFVTPDSIVAQIEAAIVGLDPSSGFIITSDPDGCTVFVSEPAPAPIPLTAPTLTGLTAGKSQATATWTAPSPLDPLAPITDYSIRYRIVGVTAWNYFAHAASAALTRATTGLANGATNNYELQVAAVNAAGVGAYTASMTVTPGAVNATVFSHSGAVAAADLVGTAPTVGPEVWAGTAGNFSIESGYIASKAGASGGLHTVGVGAHGLFKLSGVINIATNGSVAVGSRQYLKYKDATNYLFTTVGVTPSNVVNFTMVINASGAFATLALGMPAGAIPTATAAADYPFTVGRTSETTVVFTMNGIARTVTLTAPQAAAMTDISSMGLVASTPNVKFKNLVLAVNGYYN